MIDVPQPEEQPFLYPWSARDAKREERDWDHETLLKGQENRNHIRFLRAYGFAVIVFLLFFAALFLSALGAWTLHYLLPDTYHWLTSEQLSKIQSVLFSGSIGGIVSIVAQKHLT